MDTGSPRHGSAPAAQHEPDESASASAGRQRTVDRREDGHPRLRPLAGAVLCGGESRRMGADKAALVVEGERLVERVARRLSTAADPVVVASGGPGRLGPLPWDEVADDRPGRGPLGGLVAVLDTSPHALVAVVAVDLPLASAPLLRWLAEQWTGEDALIPLDEDGRRQPLHAVYTRRIAPHLRAALDGNVLAIGRALEGLDVRLVPALEWGAAGIERGWALNLNTAHDLDSVRAFVASPERAETTGIDPTPGGLG